MVYRSRHGGRPRRSGKRAWAGAAAVALLTLALAAGCSMNARDNDRNTRPKPAPEETTRSTAAARDPGDRIAAIVRSHTDGDPPVDAIVVGNVAVIGVGSKSTEPPQGTPAPAPSGTRGTPPAGANRGPATGPGTTVPPAGTRPGVPANYTPAAGSTGQLDATAMRAVTEEFPWISRAYTTTDARLRTEISSLAGDVRAKRPVDARIDEINRVVRAVMAAGMSAPNPTAQPRRPAPADPGNRAPAPGGTTRTPGGTTRPGPGM